MSGFSVFPVTGIPELREGDDLAAIIVERVELEDLDVVVVAQKAISKIEGRVVRLDDVEPSARAIEIAGDEGDPRRVEWILREAKRVVRVRPPLVICETKHGFICASAGVDQSNTPEAGTLILLPVDPDGSAAKLRGELQERTGREVGVIVTDSFGRPWRQGTTDVAIGAAGVEVMRDLSGERDPIGYELKATFITIADEIAGAAQLASGKLDRAPVTIVRGPVAATLTGGLTASSDGSMSSSRDIVETTPSISTSSRRKKPWSRSRYSSKRATGIGFSWSTFMAPSPRPIENDARPPETPCSVAIASAARSGWRSGTATAVPTFSVEVAAAASARTTNGSGSRPCASPTASPSQPAASNDRANSAICVTGTGVAPIRQNSGDLVTVRSLLRRPRAAPPS